MELQFEVKPVGVKYICDKCNEGEMLPTGKNKWLNEPPQIEHKCNKCRYIQNFKETYPLIRYLHIN
ncbi:hypothetical protein [Alkalihalophilus marmarensis]|uniref:hypothetical protein n=1 Tax=Alkalihalophilus marmarensis TaxID=521377 RepID=UPI002E223BCD|nr:hypothetical protein [Alkalihalophilus marmarensis]